MPALVKGIAKTDQVDVNIAGNIIAVVSAIPPFAGIIGLKNLLPPS